MSSIAKIFKEEIQRIVRREISQLKSDQKKALSGLKKSHVEARRRLAALEKQYKALSPGVRHRPAGGAQVPEAPEGLRVTAKSLKSMRKRLGITQAELAALLGVSSQVVAVWETKEGRVQIRSAAVRAALAALKNEKKVDVYARLGKDRKIKKSGKARGSSGLGAQPVSAAGVDGSGIVKLRKRLGLSQQEFATLVGVSNQLVSVWERKKATLKLRANTARQLKDVMKISKAEAKRRLA